VQPRVALARISQAKNRMETPQAIATAAWNPRDEQFAKVYAGYATALTGSNALDFDDLLLKTADLFQQSERVRTKTPSSFRFVMVDEYQDTNRPQYLLIRSPGGRPPQSLRRRRSRPVHLQVARRRPAQILDFERDFPEARIVKLERKLPFDTDHPRCGVGRHPSEPERKDNICDDRKGGDRIVYFRGTDDLEEADYIHAPPAPLLADDVEATVAVLYRNERAVAHD